jgi:eukaryotic-like serine/threonine-protein kinase
MNTDLNLLFAVLALQSGLITADQFVQVCTLWTTRKGTAMSDLLLERGWIVAGDVNHIHYLLDRRLEKSGGDARQSIATIDPSLKRQLASIHDAELQQSLGYVHDSPGSVNTAITLGALPDEKERYLRIRVHATGGGGRIWLAHDSQLDRDVALKELRPEVTDDATLWARFQREARITGQLEHPGIVPVYEYVRRAEHQPFYTMRFVKGRTLAEAAREFHLERAAGRVDPISFVSLLNAFTTVCNTIAYAHSRGVIHRDLKGQNIVLGDFGEVVVLDWLG